MPHDYRAVYAKPTYPKMTIAISTSNNQWAGNTLLFNGRRDATFYNQATVRDTIMTFCDQQSGNAHTSADAALGELGKALANRLDTVREYVTNRPQPS